MDRLAAILARMLRSALAWEDEHSRPREELRPPDGAEALTCIPLRIHCPPRATHVGGYDGDRDGTEDSHREAG